MPTGIQDKQWIVFVFFLGWGIRHVLERLLRGYSVEWSLVGKQKFSRLIKGDEEGSIGRTESTKVK